MSFSCIFVITVLALIILALIQDRMRPGLVLLSGAVVFMCAGILSPKEMLEGFANKGMVTVATHDANIYLPLAELVDIDAELERIEKEKAKAEENLKRIEAKLANESFTSRAPENVVNAEREKAEKARALIAKLEESAAAMKL